MALACARCTRNRRPESMVSRLRARPSSAATAEPPPSAATAESPPPRLLRYPAVHRQAWPPLLPRQRYWHLRHWDQRKRHRRPHRYRPHG